MANFFSGIAPGLAEQIEQLTRLQYDLRENIKGLLDRYGVADAPALLASIGSGEAAEHPAYEHYLSLLALDELRQETHGTLTELLREANR